MFKTMSNNAYRHGGRALGQETPEHVSWRGMKRRCSYSPHYLKHNVSYVIRWEDFQEFLSDMGPRPEGTTLDRIDTRADYSPENCRWATYAQQSRNRRDAFMVQAFGEERNVHYWSDEFGVNAKTIKKRLSLGWEPDHAVSTPPSTGRTPEYLRKTYVQNN